MEPFKYIIIIYSFFALISLIRYFFYLLVSPFYTIQTRRIENSTKFLSKKEIEENIKISVIVPAWNEEVGIITSINSLIKNSYKNLEIIIVNDGSTDNTNEKISSLLKKLRKSKVLRTKKIVYINKKKNEGKGAAINSGIKVSSGDIIVTMDADTRFEKNAISKVAQYFTNSSIQAAVGNIKIQNSNNLVGLLQRIEYIIGFYFKRTHSLLNSEYIIGGAFAAYRKDLFLRYGYFNQQSKTEDMEFSTRLRSKGVKTIYIEDAIAYTEGPSTFKGLLKQRLRWRKGALDVYIRYSNLFFSTKTQHNKFLCWFILPITIISLIELLFFPILYPILFFYIIQIGNFSYSLVWLLFYCSTIYILYFFRTDKNNWKDALFIPFFLPFVYVLIISEIYALYNSIILMIKNKDIIWQSWQRKGIENV